MENKIDLIISRILSGSGTSEDILLLTDWLNADKKHKEEFLKIKDYWEAEVSFNYSVTPAISIEKLQKKINKQEKKRKHRQQIWFILAPIAAVIIFAVIFSSRLFQKDSTVDKQNFYTYITGNNISDINLADGSKIRLNRNSRITYTGDYGQTNRAVKLEGEAYFDIKKDPKNPFTVEMEDASIRVLGTIFNLNADIGNNLITATLIEGSIRFESPVQQVTLIPNQQLVYNSLSREVGIRSIDVEEVTAWKDGLIKYKSIVFTSLMIELEKRYNTKIIIQNKKWVDPTVTVSGSFSEEQTLEQILQVITRSLPIKWSKKENVYYIK